MTGEIITTERKRLRELLPGIQLGHWPTGPKNGITDVPGVLVHTQSIHGDNGNVNTGVTTILPNKDWFYKGYYAGMFRYNGCGELTGSHWINETGTLVSPIIITSSFSVGACHTGIYKYAAQHHCDDDGSAQWFLMPVVGETYDGYLNDQSQFCVTPEHVIEGIKNASDAPVQEGNTGGGTAMICQGYKGGTGTSSRVVPAIASNGADTSYTVAALVQANYGRQKQLHIAGVPVGRILTTQDAKNEAKAKAAQAIDDAKDKTDGSIIIVLATDAPLHPVELQRLATRAAGGLSRVGGYGHNTSGDIFMAFSTANEMPAKGVGYTANGTDIFKAKAHTMESVQDSTINALLEAAADAAEEAIYNALCKAETMVGFKGRKVDALPLDRVKDIMEQYQGLEQSLLG
ncbi:hypothetical protein VHEMI08304 [[Torrubiella] hemipterigena]|uniref:Peptidase family T4 protein n=1 Tax=[Torrubiella] hemipterigena TaxID=1531966 RepID=A0A0A1TD51_9HYPO|nr:hypothetical protein VHEMI08304 [[Torrubiella] hemipterigena]